MSEETTNTFLLEICRLCLKERGRIFIFDKEEMLDNIYKCTGLKLSPLDKLPQKICQICLDIVLKATELRIIAKKNDLHLRCVFNNPQDETSMEQSEVLPEENKTTSLNKNVTENEHATISVRKDLFHNFKTENSQNLKEEVEAHNSRKLILQMKPTQEIKNMEYKCPVCSKIFCKWKKLYIHHRLHNKCYKCSIDICDKKFATKGDLEKHIRTHTGEKPYACHECDKSFAQRGTLKAHRESVHT